ncbi:MAG: histone [Promethearchaeota archaeon]
MAKKRFFAWSPTRSLMSNVGAKIVNKSAVDYLISYLEEEAVEITKKAITFAKHANRKKITSADVQLAIKEFS